MRSYFSSQFVHLTAFR